MSLIVSSMVVGDSLASRHDSRNFSMFAVVIGRLLLACRSQQLTR